MSFLSAPAPRPIIRSLRLASALLVRRTLALGALCGAFALPDAARAQSVDPQTGAAMPAEPPAIVPFSNFYVTAGQAKFDVGGINARFNNANGFFAFSGDGYTTGLGFYIPLGGVIAGMEYHNLDMGYESTPAGKTNLLNAAMAQMRVGFRMVTTWDLTIHADLQMGIGNVSARFRDRTGGASINPATNPTWDDILLAPGAQSEMKGRFYYVAPGAGIDYIFLKDIRAQRGFTVGLQIASSIAPHRTTWTYGGNTVFGAPDAAPVGAQVRVTFGYGGFTIKNPGR